MIAVTPLRSRHSLPVAAIILCRISAYSFDFRRPRSRSARTKHGRSDHHAKPLPDR
jgi:hypothetical protein